MRKRGRIQQPSEAAAAPKPDTLLIPHDPINEAVVFAAVIVSPEARQRYLTLPSSLFLAPGHADAWTCLQDLFQQGLQYDPATVRQLSGGRVNPDVLDAYIAARPELPPNLAHHVEMLAWDAARIAAAKGPIAALLDALRDPTQGPDAVRSIMRQCAQAFDGHGAGKFVRSSKVVLAEHSAELTSRRSGHASYPYGISGLDFYGEADFDERHLVAGRPRPLAGRPRMVPGAGPGQLTVVTGSSGNGKTTKTARNVLYWANQKQKTLWGAWEQRNGPSLELLAAMSLGWSLADVKIGDYSEAEQRELEAEMERIGEFVQFLDLPFGRKVNDRARNDANFDLIQRAISDAGCDHFIADLFHQAMVDTKPDDEVRALYRYKAIGHEEGCHMVAASQIRLKDAEEREDPRPTRALLKGSSAYIEAADTVLAMFRPALYKTVPDDKIEIHILKQRHGKWPQCVECEWDPEYGLIEGGHTIVIDRPGEKGAVDNYLDDVGSKPARKTSGGRRRF